MRSRALIAAILLASLQLAAGASAQSAEELIAQGIEARRLQQDDSALVLFRRAHEMNGSAEALAQMALAEQALGRWVDAYGHLQAALRAQDPWIEGHRAPLQEALSTIESRVGRLAIECNVEGAELSVDGEVVGTLPLPEPLTVPAGPVVLDVRADGYLPRRQQENVPSGTLTRLSVRLVPTDRPTVSTGRVAVDCDVEGAALFVDGRRVATLPLAEPLELPVGPATLEVEADGYEARSQQVEVVAGAVIPVSFRLDPTVEDAPGASPTTTPSSFLYVGIATGAATVLSLAGAVVALAIREENVLLWNDDARCPEIGADGRLAMCADEYSAWRSAEDWAVATAVTTGVLAAATATFFALAAAEGDTVVTPEAGPTSVGVRLRQRF